VESNDMRKVQARVNGHQSAKLPLTLLCKPNSPTSPIGFPMKHPFCLPSAGEAYQQ